MPLWTIPYIEVASFIYRFSWCRPRRCGGGQKERTREAIYTRRGGVWGSRGTWTVWVLDATPQVADHALHGGKPCEVPLRQEEIGKWRAH